MDVPFVCSVCLAGFDTAGELAEHQTARHEPDTEESELEHARRRPRGGRPPAQNVGFPSVRPDTFEPDLAAVDRELAPIIDRACHAIDRRDVGELFELERELEAIARSPGASWRSRWIRRFNARLAVRMVRTALRALTVEVKT